MTLHLVCLLVSFSVCVCLCLYLFREGAGGWGWVEKDSAEIDFVCVCEKDCVGLEKARQ